MPRLEWDKTGEHIYETGVRNGVLYPINASGAYPEGYAWNGITAVTESPTGADAEALYADDIKYLNLIAAEEFEATLEAYTYPDQFAECNGEADLGGASAIGAVIGQQARKTFGLSYRTALGNDVLNDAYGYKLHLIYGCVASPSERSYETINDSPAAITFSWDIKTTPVTVTGFKPTANVTIDSTKVTDAVAMAKLEAVLYGAEAEEFSATKTYAVGTVVTKTSGSDEETYICKKAVTAAGEWDDENWEEFETELGPRLPLPDEIKAILTA